MATGGRGEAHAVARVPGVALVPVGYRAALGDTGQTLESSPWAAEMRRAAPAPLGPESTDGRRPAMASPCARDGSAMACWAATMTQARRSLRTSYAAASMRGEGGGSGE